MLTLKISVAIVILAGTAAVAAGASYLVTRTTMQANVAVSCPAPVASAAENRSVPLGGLPLPTNQGKKW
ncbi:MAG: hypothetical protein RQ966_14975 [Acetobacteraceae bacterium]|nr:hypothetical protein [Acetobacteraceae bacterium]